MKNYIFCDEEIHSESDRMLVIMSVQFERLLQVPEFTLIFCRFFDRVLSPSIPMRYTIHLNEFPLRFQLNRLISSRLSHASSVYEFLSGGLRKRMEKVQVVREKLNKARFF